MSFLEMISQTAPILWVAESDYGYPTVLTLHSLGMALVVGIVMMFDLRVLGVAPHIPLQALRAFFPFAWLGLAINVVSGTLLFCANSSVFLNNTAFISKLALLCGAALASWLLARHLRGEPPRVAAPAAARALAGLCLALLLAAIIAGRVIGYTSVPE